jgi:hypothetical protein
MAHLITPIEIDGAPYCCQPATKRTEAILTGMASELGANQWEIYRAYQDETVREGAVKFGICCAMQIEITLNGMIETLNDGYDWIEVVHNGQRVFFHESLDTSEDPDETVAAGPFNITLRRRHRQQRRLVAGRRGDQLTAAPWREAPRRS